jgi:hypothetical protein
MTGRNVPASDVNDGTLATTNASKTKSVIVRLRRDIDGFRILARLSRLTYPRAATTKGR